MLMSYNQDSGTGLLGVSTGGSEISMHKTTETRATPWNPHAVDVRVHNHERYSILQKNIERPGNLPYRRTYRQTERKKEPCIDIHHLPFAALFF